MIAILTFQDFSNAPDKHAFIINAVDNYMASPVYAKAIEADTYYAGNNSAVHNLKTELAIDGKSIDLTAAIRTSSAIFKRLVTQLCQSIWAYGVQLDSDETKARLGPNFDKTTEAICKKAVLHGTCYGFWNYDRLQRFTALEYFPLKDERSGNDMAGIRFWRIAPDKPMYIQLFEQDGWSEFIRNDKDNSLSTITPKSHYVRTFRRDAFSSDLISSDNYGSLLPVIPLYANEDAASELSAPIKSKIDLYDFILSGFGDSVMRTKTVYWILQGFSGHPDDLLGILNEIQKLGIIAPADSSSAAAHTVDLPFAAVQFALNKLEEGIYLDFMGMRLSEITGGNLTNVAIQTAQYNLMMKVSDFEWQVFLFVQRILALQGVFTENIRFKKKSIYNDMDICRMLSLSRSDLDLRTALEKNPLVDPDEVELIIRRKTEESNCFVRNDVNL